MGSIRQHILVKRVSLIALVILTPLTLVSCYIDIVIDGKFFPDGTVRIIAMMTAIGVSYLIARQGSIQPAIFLLILTVVMATLAYPLIPWITSRPQEDFFILLFVFPMISVVIVTLHDLHKDRFAVIAWLAICYFLFFYALTQTIQSMDVRYIALKFGFEDSPVLWIAFLLANLFILLMCISLKLRNSRKENDLDQIQADLRTKDALLRNQSKELSKRRKQLKKITADLGSDTQGLDDELLNRFEQLDQRNMKLLEMLQLEVTEFRPLLTRLRMTGDITNIQPILDELENKLAEVSKMAKE